MRYLPILFATLLAGCAGGSDAPPASAPTPAPKAASAPAPPAPAVSTAPAEVPVPAPDQVDTSCQVDSDCAVKDVGNCCGYYPACVNKDSPTFPERVKAECAEKNMSSICGFPEINGCACVAGTCSARPAGATE